MFAVATLAFSAVPAGADQACATNHMRARLEAFSEGSVSRPLYWITENGGQATFTVRIIGSGCDGSTSTISYEIQPGSATTPADYVAPSGSITFVNTVGHPDTEERDVTITNDAFPLDAPVEMATVVLTGATGGALIPPTSAPVIIVEDDGPTPLISLAEGQYGENESTPEGGVPVFRAGDASATSTVDWALTAGTATPGDDYSEPTSGILTFVPGDRMELIPVTVVDDSEKEAPETLTVSISGPLTEGNTTSVPFTITDNEEDIPPTSSLHHPNNKKKYRASHFLIREIHIFTMDQGGAGTVAAEFALRRNMKGGKCAWWSGKRFKKGKCDGERWLKTGQYETDFFYIRLKELQPSVGKIRNYTAYSRAIDGAKNVETQFEVGRNANTFKVRKPK